MATIVITTMPEFIKGYINNRKYNADLKDYWYKSINIIRGFDFKIIHINHRNILEATFNDNGNIEEFCNTIFCLDKFFNFYFSKLQKVDDNKCSLYEKELGIEDNLNNEVFYAKYIDEYGDEEDIQIVLRDYIKSKHYISFMII